MSIPILLVAFALVGCATTSTTPKLPPIGDSGQWLPGKIIWRDLVTPSPDPCRKFYTGLFGWEFEPVQDSGYFLIRSGGELVGGLVDANKLGRKPETAVWISAISVVDVDECARRVPGLGGKTLQEPKDIPGRGRSAIIEDSAGAVLRLFRTEQGDPPDQEVKLNRWLWMELITDDPAAATAFYQAAFGYEAPALNGAEETDYRVLKQSGMVRAGIRTNPFEKTRPVWIPCVRVASVRETTGKVALLGGQVVVAPDEAHREGRVALVLDPAGAPLMIQEWTPKTGKGGAQ